ncbi:AMP binding domain protein, putative [Talaromyces stipitatus ATCC 10500]|uniref:AMP binding domain protein, putative n=1 Tax=Talaromyces stipitatus (strain ATCC 10500 / CBS 375.48 / QM 6759 / NRRL 1006) TaxID=441959 RepID=B8M2U0_TALSN|nr:AMP binding domain protein, putative [Talaromyces stipitatus ATCC 10500]EED22195.1 AMP binding domain protein, putative [Talaromyces stipitatus ATCC 10500]
MDRYQKRRTLLFSQFLGSGNNGVQPPSVTIQGPGGQVDNYSGRYPDVGSDSSSGIARQRTPSLQLPDRAASRASVDSLFLPKTSHHNTLDVNHHEDSRTGTLMSQNYAFNPNEPYDRMSQVSARYDPNVYDPGAYEPDGGQTRQSTLLDSQAYFQDFAGHQNEDYRNSYGGGYHRYSQSDAFSPTANMAPPLMPASEIAPGSMLNHLLPLEPRDIPFSVYDPYDPNTMMSKFDNLPAVLRHRAKTQSKQPAYWVLDQKGKEIASITWDKLASRAEKVAQIIRDKSSLYRGDRVALIYRDTEIIEFAVALMGCFIAGVVAVPINNIDDYASLSVILTSTQAHLALTTENNLKNFQRDITTQKLQWPRGVEWWKTNEFGSYHPKKKDDVPPLVVPDLAYIEFSRAPTGDLRGVVMSHRTIMHQMACLSAILSTVPGSKGVAQEQSRVLSGSRTEILFSYLDPRQSIGMILGILLTVYGGHTTVWLEAQAVETPGLYAHLITKYRATVMAADYPGLKRVAYNYQQDPMTTRHFKKNSEPNFSSVKLCLIDTLTVDSEFHEILADRWLRPMRNPRAREIVAPMLCLPEHGGMVISVRDWLGGEERMGCPLTHPLDPQEPEQPEQPETEKKKTENNDGFGSSLIGGTPVTAPKKKVTNDLAEVLLDKEALKSNEVVVLAMGEEARKLAETRPNSVRVGAFGYPLPDATLAIVDPETNLLCTPNVIGEIWVDSPSLSGGFWALPKHTETIFHARPYKFDPGNPTPVLVEPEFLRTGLLGCVIEGKIFVLGLYEDRLRQKVEWVEHGQEIVEHRYFFVQHLIISIMRNVPKVNDCSAFDVFVNEEHLPIVVLESYTASTAPTTSGGPPRQLDVALLESLAERCMEVLYQEHHLRVYCVMITAPNTLPRVTKNGRQEIGNMLCRKEFDNGTLPCVHVKFGAERAVMNLPLGVDPVGGMWSPLSSDSRQEILAMEEKQYSGVDYRDIVMDDRTSTPLNNFTNIVDLVQWRVTRQAEELCYCSVDGRGKESKGVTWKKFDTKVAAVASYLKNKVKVKPGDHLVLMYTHSEEYVFAVHACLCLGAIAIPMAPIDQNRLPEDAPAFLHVISDFKVKAIIVNTDVDHVMKQKLVSQHIKQSAQVLRIGVPAIYNTTKPPKQSHGCRDLGFTMNKAWLQANHPAVIWTHWTADQRRISVQLNHDTLMAMCKVQKETCQMTSARPVLGSVRSTVGLGFLHTCLLGVYVGAPTYLVSPVDFAQNPASLFVALARYKIKDTYATGQMLEYAMSSMAGKGFQLQELKNLMIATDGRPKVDMYQKVRLHFAATALDRTAINTIYSHVLNPMVASRSYMCIEPIELWLDLRALRRGMVYPVDPDVDPTALRLQDSGMVPVNTQLAIVNPETCTLCRVGEYGEIWIQSDACAKSFYGSKQEFDLERFNGKVLDGDTSVQYVRTGDLGFLHTVTRPIGPGGQPVEMQVLFVLGGIGETFEINGLNHFPVDIEASVEKCHRNIVAGGCAVFQAGGLVVVLVEVTRKSYLASLVPVIVNAVLNDHQIVIDIVAFVSLGDFPRSRLGEKQRGKILGSWVTRKMRTIAQFSIRDAEGADAQMLQTRMSRGSKTGSMMGGSSLRRSTLVPDSDSSTRVATAPVQERRELVDEPYTMQEDEEEKHYQDLLNDPGYTTGNDASRGFQEHHDVSTPQPLTIETHQGYEKEKNTTPVLSPDDGFDFGDSFGQTGYDDDHQDRGALTTRNVPSVAVAPPSTAGSQDSRVSHTSPPRRLRNDRGNLPSQQQQQQYSRAPQVSSPTESQSWLDTSQRPNSTEDWPQEALLYQSHFDEQDANGQSGKHPGNFNAF